VAIFTAANIPSVGLAIYGTLWLTAKEFTRGGYRHMRESIVGGRLLPEASSCRGRRRTQRLLADSYPWTLLSPISTL
jgi:hypothetical protein